jgi:uncharacterized protein (DUF934 family)
MRHILRRLEGGRWQGLLEPAPAAGESPVALSALRQEPQRWRSQAERHGVQLAPADRVEELLPELASLKKLAVEFPNPGDGRGYSSGRLLRERYRFGGELRALGAGVRQDQVFLLARCGFDAIELADGEDPAAAQRALRRYEVGYQPGAAQVPLRWRRFCS